MPVIKRCLFKTSHYVVVCFSFLCNNNNSIIVSSSNVVDWAAHNYPRPRTNTADWLYKAIDRNVSDYYCVWQLNTTRMNIINSLNVFIACIDNTVYSTLI